MSLYAVPVTLAEAKEFTRKHHRRCACTSTLAHADEVACAKFTGDFQLYISCCDVCGHRKWCHEPAADPPNHRPARIPTR